MSNEETHKPLPINQMLENLPPEELYSTTMTQIVQTVAMGISLARDGKAQLFDSRRLWAFEEDPSTMEFSDFFRSKIWIGEPGTLLSSTGDTWDRLNHTTDPKTYQRTDRQIREFNGLPQVKGVLRENRSKVLILRANFVAGTDFNERVLANAKEVHVSEKAMYALDVTKDTFRPIEIEEMKELYRIFTDGMDKLQEIQNIQAEI